MKKVGIVTLQGLYNYGNRLQNYAVQEIVKKYGYEAESILLEGSLKEKIRECVSFFAEARVTNTAHYFIRFYNFWRFNHKNIRIKSFRINNTTLKTRRKSFTSTSSPLLSPLPSPSPSLWLPLDSGRLPARYSLPISPSHLALPSQTSASLILC